MDTDSTGIKNVSTDDALPEVKLNDNLMRAIGIPFLGIILPHITGVYDHLTIYDINYWLGYSYFIFFSGAIWQGNRYLMFRTRKRFTWFDKPIEKLILMVINNIFYTAPVTIAMLCIWYRWTGSQYTNWETILIVALINVICVLFVTHVYETVFMVKEQQNEQLRNAELSRAKAETELEALKNQIDPHFMFNSLNSLSYLITSDATKALKFTENLAEIYRYILSQKERNLVLLEDELNFMKKYTDLLMLRFGKALNIQKNFGDRAEKEYLIPPISAFVTMENVVKHNEISEQLPLQVDIQLTDNTLVISNRMQAKKSLQHSSGIGLKNLDERFKIITGTGITSQQTDGNFQVSMPLIRLNR